MVGPTGVGKTTTIAKIAAHASLVQKKKVSLVTMDTYRIGAVEQLKQYADLMHIPFYVVKNEKQFHQVLENVENSDLVLIDTAGRGPGSEEKTPRMSASFAMHDVAVHLVVSASSRSVELKKTVEKYAPMPLSGVIFTKTDEAFVWGALVNVCMYSQLPVSCITFGQRVPEDIDFPSSEKIVSDIVRKTLQMYPFQEDKNPYGSRFLYEEGALI
jgi:flagellar biosynthesis protein FlhF